MIPTLRAEGNAEASNDIPRDDANNVELECWMRYAVYIDVTNLKALTLYLDEHRGNGAKQTPDERHRPYTGSITKEMVLN